MVEGIFFVSHMFMYKNITFCHDIVTRVLLVAARIVILDEPSLPRDEADAITFGTLLTLRGEQWSGEQ